MDVKVKEVLAAVSSQGRLTGSAETAYQLGVLAAWIARLAAEDWTVRRELELRIENTRKNELQNRKVTR